MTTIEVIDPSVDILRALLWQYNEAANLEGILRAKQGWTDSAQVGFWNDWVRDVFDLRTANEFGCSVWSIILNTPLTVDTGTDPIGKVPWGFGEFHNNFNNGNFTKGSGNSTRLSIEQKRMVLRLRYFQLITRGTVPEVNAFMKVLFPGPEVDYGLGGYVDTGYVEDGYIESTPPPPLQQVYVLDGLDMTCVYVFTFVPSSQLQFVLQEYDLLPRPSGVSTRYVIAAAKKFGFDEFHLNFNNSNFGG